MYFGRQTKKERSRAEEAVVTVHSWALCHNFWGFVR